MSAKMMMSRLAPVSYCLIDEPTFASDAQNEIGVRVGFLPATGVKLGVVPSFFDDKLSALT